MKRQQALDTHAPIMRVSGLRKAYDGDYVLDGIDWEIPPGRIVGLLGRNGAGKTTLMRSRGWDELPLLDGALTTDTSGARLVAVVDGVSPARIEQQASMLDAEVRIEPMSLEGLFVALA